MALRVISWRAMRAPLILSRTPPRLSLSSASKKDLSSENQNSSTANHTSPSDGLTAASSSSEVIRFKKKKSTKKSPYRYFEDQYPTAPPTNNNNSSEQRYSTYEDQLANGATVRSLELQKPRTESERLQAIHNWKEDPKNGWMSNPNFGWCEDWGPAPDEDGHNDWYKKQREYMSYDEKVKYDMRYSVPIENKTFRHQEMPMTKRIRAAGQNLVDSRPQYFETTSKKWDANYTFDEKKDTVMEARNGYMKEWLEKKDVTPQNLAMKMSEYNGTATHKEIRAVPRKPEWELAPLKDE